MEGQRGQVLRVGKLYFPDLLRLETFRGYAPYVELPLVRDAQEFSGNARDDLLWLARLFRSKKIMS
jgi:hypothetical protein